MIFGLRTDVLTMNLIVSQYRRWQKQRPEDELSLFIAEFIEERYDVSNDDGGRSRTRASRANRALEFYVQRLNHDQDFSLLALLGALSEAEGFAVRPGAVVKRVYSKNQDIPSYIFGGFGIDDLEKSFTAAGNDFRAQFKPSENPPGSRMARHL